MIQLQSRHIPHTKPMQMHKTRSAIQDWIKIHELILFNFNFGHGPWLGGGGGGGGGASPAPLKLNFC